MMKIIKTEELPPTTNAWGFNGSANKVKYTMENGDVWISATAYYRHHLPENYLQLKKNSPEFTGGLTADLDILKGRNQALKYIENYYKPNN